MAWTDLLRQRCKWRKAYGSANPISKHYSIGRYAFTSRPRLLLFALRATAITLYYAHHCCYYLLSPPLLLQPTQPHTPPLLLRHQDHCNHSSAQVHNSIMELTCIICSDAQMPLSVMPQRFVCDHILHCIKTGKSRQKP
jgi:hypothetical protein